MNKWYSEFSSISGTVYRVEIEDETLAANREFKLGADAVVLNYEKGDHKYAPLRSSSATVNCATAYDMSSIYTQLWDRKLTVTDTSTETVIFSGYVIPSQWEQPARTGVNQFTIEAQDGLGYLAKKKYGLKNSARRSVLTFGDYVTRCAALIGCTVSWNIQDTDAPNYKFSEDVLLPDDYSEGETSRNWKYYADGLEMIGLYLGVFFFIRNNKLIVCEYENTTETWIENAEEQTRSSELTMSIEPAVSKVIGSPSAGSKVWLNDILSEDRMKKQTGFSWGKGNWNWGRYRNGTGDSLHKISKATPAEHKDLTDASNIMAYATTDKDGKWPDQEGSLTPVTFGGFTVKDLAGHVNIKDNTTIEVTTELFMQSKAFTEYPHDWVTSREENLTSGTFTPHLMVQVNGSNSTCYPGWCKTYFDSEETGYFRMVYQFILPAGSVTFKGMVYQDNIIETCFYFKSIKCKEAVEMENDERTISSDFDNTLSVDLPLMYDTEEAMINYKGAVNTSGNISVSSPLLSKLVNQYKVCRHRFSMYLPFYNFGIDKRVIFRGYSCTVDSAQIELRYDRVQVNILESYNTQENEN